MLYLCFTYALLPVGFTYALLTLYYLEEEVLPSRPLLKLYLRFTYALHTLYYL
jgi:hypothetical protein